MTEVEQMVFEYFSSLGPLARKVMQDQELVRSMYGAEWEQMSYEQRDSVIDEYVIKSEILEHYKNYSRWEEPPEYFPKLKLGSGEKIIVDDTDFRTWQDEHSGPFCWETKSQLDMPLFETEEDREKAAKARKWRPRSPDLKKLKNINPFKQGKSIWDSPFLAADRGRDSGYPMDVNELGKTPEEMDQELGDPNYEECGEASPNYEECGDASSDSGVNGNSPVDQVMASPDKSVVSEDADDLFQKFHISFGSNDDSSSIDAKKKSSPPEPFGDNESVKKSEESSPAYSPVGSPVFARDTKPLVKTAPKPAVKTPPKPVASTTRPAVNTPPKPTSAPPTNKRPPPIPFGTKPKPKYEPECDDSYEFVEVNRNNNFMVSNLSSTENSPIRSIKKDETTALLQSSTTTETKPTKAAKPVRKKHDSASSNSSSAALLPDDSPFRTALSNSVVTTQPVNTPVYDEYEPQGIDNKKVVPDKTPATTVSDDAASSKLTGFDFLDNW